jgi:hypothetical protein
MTQVICRASTCLFWEDSICGAEEIEYEPDVGCLTFQDMGDIELEEVEEEDFGWSDEPADDLFAEDDDWEGDDDDDEWDEF